MENKQSGKLPVILLAVLLVVVAGFAFYSNQENNRVKEELNAEKAEIKQELDKMIADYDAKIAESSSLKVKLGAARQDIIAYRDSLTNEKSTSYKVIKRYKNRVYSLQAKNKELFAQVENLTKENSKLNVEIGEAKSTIDTLSESNKELEGVNKILNEKVAIGGALTVSNLNVVAMKKLSTGALAETNRYKKTDAFRISFKINENLLSVKGNKEAYFVIKDPNDAVVAPKGKTAINGEDVDYSDSTTIDYQNMATEVIIITDMDKKETSKGVYSVTAFLDGKAVGSTTLELKPNFLGVF
jgi:predicted nuclease with TOPRIM domain